ncbi:MAG TPA: hypothetical protein VFH94_23365 [Streptomyces sp.]|nr:hypothetical protein [Streptomyces sp.]
MTTHLSDSGTSPGPRADRPWGLAARGPVFAGVLLSISGVLTVLQGISAIAKNAPYRSDLDYAYGFNIAAWGWIHLIFGAALLVAGIGLLKAMAWAKGAGMLIAATTMALQFVFLPYYPAWALIAITLDILVLWALILHSDEAVD